MQVLGFRVLGFLIAFLPFSAARADSCPDLMQPKTWFIPLAMLRHARAAGPPQIAQAISALETGDRPEAVRLLTEANRLPIDFHTQPLDHIRAIVNAGAAAWTLSGCPERPESKG